MCCVHTNTTRNLPETGAGTALHVAAWRIAMDQRNVIMQLGNAAIDQISNNAPAVIIRKDLA